MEFSLQSLEFDRLKDVIARYTSTSGARELLAQLNPSTNQASLEEEHAITAEAMLYLRESRVGFHNVEFLHEAIHKLTITGSILEISEIEAIKAFLSQVEGLRVRWKDEREMFPLLAGAAHRLPDLRELSKQLGRAVRDGEIDERYSPELARIRRVLNAARARLTDRLQSMVKSPAYADQVQDQVITIRNGRFVIPVRTEQKRSLDGIIHGSSSSGATVFIEPVVSTSRMCSGVICFSTDVRGASCASLLSWHRAQFAKY